VCGVDRYTVNFVPRESGLHYVHVKLNGIHVPGSPYAVQVGRVDADVSQVRAYGDGLYKGFTGTAIRRATVFILLSFDGHLALCYIVYCCAVVLSCHCVIKCRVTCFLPAITDILLRR